MPLFNYGRTPGYAPGGRPINPETGHIADMPGGSDYLAGFGPPPKGVVDTPGFTNIINRRLGGSMGLGVNDPQSVNHFIQGLMKWGNPAHNARAIELFNSRYGTTLTPSQIGVQTAAPMQQAANPMQPTSPMVPPVSPVGGGTGAAMGTPVIPTSNADIGMPVTPWTPSWGVPGLVYGLRSGRSSFGG